MRLVRQLVLAAALLAASPAPAGSATVIAPSLSPYGGRAWFCILENVGKNPIDATVTQYAPSGTEINQFTRTLDPFTPFLGADNGSEGGTCQVEFKGSKKAVRAFICIMESNVGCVQIMPAQ